MNDRLAIVTGSSSGIGAALTDRLLETGWIVFGVARREVKRSEANYRHVQADLADPDVADTVVAPLVTAEMAFANYSSVALINNAATEGQLRHYGSMNSKKLFAGFATNLAAPVALMNALIRDCPPDTELKIVNVSSGLAHKPLAGLSEYCAAKAGLRMAGQVLAAERPDLALLSYEPGIVDTVMQNRLRNQHTEAFSSV